MAFGLGYEKVLYLLIHDDTSLEPPVIIGLRRVASIFNNGISISDSRIDTSYGGCNQTEFIITLLLKIIITCILTGLLLIAVIISL